MPKKKRLRVIQLVAVIFLTVSGGPYGLEPLLTYAGNNGALLLVITPILWDIPTVLTVLELNSMMPVEGGYYQWVKKALGLRFAFYEGWWTWLYTFVDLAIYPVLFVEYASFFFPGIEAYKIPICLVIIWAGAGLNIRGIVPVGEASLVLGAAVIIPFVILFITAFASHNKFSFALPHLSISDMHFSSLGLALFTVMWNFCGWDNTMTYAEEVNKPVRSYIRSTIIALVLVFTVYFITIITAQASGINYDTLNDEGFPALGSLIGGQWLGVLIAAGGMASTLGLFSAVLLSVSRVPKVMSDDKLLPKKLNREHPKFKTPYVSIIVCACIVSVMVLWTFADLLVIDITLYGAGLLLEFISLIVLRRKMPGANRPFKIKLNVTGLCVMTLVPFSVYFIAMAGSFMEENFSAPFFAIAALSSAEIIWQIITRINPSIKSASDHVPLKNRVEKP